ncbi:MAG TPA: dTDP-4-dehydrorhamnose reductase [Pyrinomonadaceae bacterium]
MRISIAGAGGFVGGALARHFSRDHQVSALSRRELDITNREAVRNSVLRARPRVVINCAVLGVDDCEKDPAMARAVHVAGAEHLAEACAEVEADFVQLSSNYVFDGKLERGSFYTVADEPKPISVYGETKLAGESAARETWARTFVVRTSWVFGAGKDNFFSTAPKRLIESVPLCAVTDVWASTTYLPDLVARLDEILRLRHCATYHVVNEGVCSYYEFATEAARQLGITSDDRERLIEPVNEAEMERLALRPRYTPMRCSVSESLGLMPLRDWREALSRYLHSSGMNGVLK